MVTADLAANTSDWPGKFHSRDSKVQALSRHRYGQRVSHAHRHGSDKSVVWTSFFDPLFLKRPLFCDAFLS